MLSSRSQCHLRLSCFDEIDNFAWQKRKKKYERLRRSTRKRKQAKDGKIHKKERFQARAFPVGGRMVTRRRTFFHDFKRTFVCVSTKGRVTIFKHHQLLYDRTCGCEGSRTRFSPLALHRTP
jgi:hypothetical protein